MSSNELQRLADRDGIRVRSANPHFAFPGIWEVTLEYQASPPPGCHGITQGWPSHARGRPTEGQVLDEWFAVVAGRGPEAPPPEVVDALHQSLTGLLGDRFTEYRNAANGSGSGASAGASGGCLMFTLIGLAAAVCALVWGTA